MHVSRYQEHQSTDLLSANACYCASLAGEEHKSGLARAGSTAQPYGASLTQPVCDVSLNTELTFNHTPPDLCIAPHRTAVTAGPGDLQGLAS
jgi:hypothetical protein